MRTALLRGKRLYTPCGEFRCPSGLPGVAENGEAALLEGSVARGSLRFRDGSILAEIWDSKGSWLLETLDVILPSSVVKLQEKTHTLPEGGETTQYTITVPRHMVESLGWRKGDRVEMNLVPGDMVKVTKPRSEWIDGGCGP